MLSFYRFLLGYVRIFVFGVAPERFINYCASNGISVWNIKRKNDGIYLNIGLSDYKNLREIRRKIDRSIRVKLQEKHGLVFISKKVIKRPGLITGIAMFFIINIALSQFVWNIDIVAPNSIDKNQIISVLSELGVSTGVPRQSIDTYNLSQLLALRIDNIAWVSLNVEGSNLTVNISVASESEKNPENTPSNIVASFDGVIKSAEIIEGKKEFLLGQAVRKGDLLVSGVISDDTNTKFVHSKGEILADTQRVFSVEVMKDLLLETEVNRTQYRSILKIFWLEIHLYLHDVDGYSDSIYNVFSLKKLQEKDDSMFKKQSEYGKMLDMLCSYTIAGKNKHDDVPDAFAMLSEFAQSISGSKVEVFKRPF